MSCGSDNFIERVLGISLLLEMLASAINPYTRTGWAFGGGIDFNPLQQFFN